ncbi:membrane-bound PQQ-dependent dehydrogenase, glucose/quinate/shikimate family [Martelella radicis]
MMIVLTTLIFAAIGLFLGGGGIWLIVLGGSWFYLIAGVAFLATAFLIFTRNPLAYWVYGATILVTLAWALLEVGFDWWQLGARGGLVVLLGLWMFLPWVRRPILRDDYGFPEQKPAARAGAWPLAGAVALSIIVAAVSLFTDPHAIRGELPGVRNAEASATDGVPADEWHAYGRTEKGQRYSPLDQITPENVGNLELAWQIQTGDMKGPNDVVETTYENTPLMIGDTLYVCTPHSWAMAFDAKTGEQKWKFDPEVPVDGNRQHQTCRGVTYYADPDIAEGERCKTRVYLPTSDARLIALNAEDGTVCEDFADNGTLHLETNMPYKTQGYYYSTSAPLAIAGKIIVGGAVNDNYSTQSPSGVIRAYDIDTGELVWNFDTGNPDRTEPIGPNETYTKNSPNSWSVMSGDSDLGLIYVPFGNRVPDQIGLNRTPSEEKYSSSVTALDAETGEPVWVFQGVHHDLWDMDVPAQPALLDLTVDGESLPALVQATKQGEVFVLNRETGEPILPVTEVAAPQEGGLEGENLSPTQPVSALSFNPPKLTGKDMWGASLLDQLACRIKLKQYNYEGRYTPPSTNGTIVYPGNFGTLNWGSVAVDPERQVMFAMPVYMAYTSTLVPKTEPGAPTQGINSNNGSPYAVSFSTLLGPLGVPCQAPPWGYVAGADLTTGEIVWKHKNGTIQDMNPLGLKIKMGVPGIGGPIITNGGVAFLGAAMDNYIRGYDLTSGEQLWEARLPAGGQATPMTYETSDGTQYVLIVAGGHGSVGTQTGDYILAYKLPES